MEIQIGPSGLKFEINKSRVTYYSIENLKLEPIALWVPTGPDLFIHFKC